MMGMVRVVLMTTTMWWLGRIGAVASEAAARQLLLVLSIIQGPK